MDKLTKYQQIIQQLLQEYAAYSSQYQEVETQLISDTQNHHYQHHYHHQQHHDMQRRKHCHSHHHEQQQQQQNPNYTQLFNLTIRNPL